MVLPVPTDKKIGGFAKASTKLSAVALAEVVMMKVYKNKQLFIFILRPCRWRPQNGDLHFHQISFP